MKHSEQQLSLLCRGDLMSLKCRPTPFVQEGEMHLHQKRMGVVKQRNLEKHFDIPSEPTINLSSDSFSPSLPPPPSYRCILLLSPSSIY
mmetsp:Transcript_16311/g.22595  ORF Transcript_16311/g.22595 Transcript_16311/m.22595 type:complete len:89 (+) Transcript_16311:587-853(+)